MGKIIELRPITAVEGIIDHTYPQADTFYPALSQVYDNLPIDNKVIREEFPDTIVTTQLRSDSDDEITIHQTSVRKNTITPFIIKRGGLIRKEGPGKINYEFYIQSGKPDNIDTTKVIYGRNDSYALTQLGVLIATTQQAQERLSSRRNILPIKKVIFNEATKEDDLSASHPHGLNLAPQDLT